MKRICSFLAVFFLLAVTLCPFICYALPAQNIQVHFTDNATPLVGAEFYIYRIGTVSEGKIIPEAPFDGYKIDYDISTTEKMSATASTVFVYAVRDDVAPLYGDNTDEYGYADFHGVAFSEGAYLVTCLKHTQDGNLYFAEPVIVIVPYGNTDSITIKPKSEKVEVPDASESESKRVLKSWIADTGSSRPVQIEVELLCDGEIYDTAILNKDNNWRYEWKNLPSGHRWLVTEKGVVGEYTVSITRTEDTILIVNKGAFVVEETTTEPEETTSPDSTTSPDETTSPGGTTITTATTTLDSTTTSQKPGGPSAGGNSEEPELPVTGMLVWPIPYLACLGIILFIIGFVKDKKEA